MTALMQQRTQLAGQIRQMADRCNRDGWSNEDKANWERLNNDYQVAHARFLAECSQNDDRTGGNMLLGRDNARIGDSGALTASLPGEHRAEAVGLGLQAWLAARVPNFRLSDAHRQAVAALGVNLGQSEITLPLSNTMGARRFQAVARRGQFQNAMQTIPGGSGGFLVPEGFIPRFETALQAYGPMLRTSEILRTSTANPMPWPTGDDTSNTGEQVGENTDSDGSTEPTLGQTTFSAYPFSSKMVKVSFQLVRDSAIDFASLIGDMLGERLGRILNTKCTTATGAATPKGILTGLTTGKTTASATAIVTDELLDLAHSVDQAHRGAPGVGWMLNDGVLLALRKLKDGDGQYIWSPGLRDGQPDTLLGYRYHTNSDMQATVATGTTTVIFGDLSKYKIRQVGSIRLRRLEERYAELDQIAFIAFLEADGCLLDAGSNPVKSLVQA